MSETYISELEAKKAGLTAEELFSPEDYRAMCAMDAETEEGQYSGKVIYDLYVRIVHREHRWKPGHMIYIVNLDQEKENLYNDDLYWRAEPVKFFNGLPSYEEVLAAVSRLLDFRADRTQNKTAVLNIDWDPKQPQFDS